MVELTSEQVQRPDDIKDDQERPGPNTIGALLRELRGDRTLREVEADTGISNSYLSNLEMGRKNPGIKSLSRLAEYYEVPLEDLVGYETLSYFRQAIVREDILATAKAKAADIKRSFDFVLADPFLGSSEKPAETPSLETQKLVVRLYELYTGKKLL